MTHCLICGNEPVPALLDFGRQALCNRFLAEAGDPESAYGLGLGQCPACGVIQILRPVAPAELQPRFDWITYNEQEGHLDELVDTICALPDVSANSLVGAIGFKDDSTVARFVKRGFARTWRLDPAADLGINNPLAGLETVQAALTPERAEQIAARRGAADVVIVRHILEHAQHTQAFAGALKRLVKPGGYLVFEVPDCEPALRRRDYSMPWEEHIVYFTPATFRHSLARLGFAEVHFKCHLYSNENSLVAIVKAGIGAPSTGLAANILEEQKALGQGYATAFAPYREKARLALGEFQQRRGKIAVFGAGHLSCFWINALGVGGHIEFVVDDHPKKRGMFMPGSRLPIRGSASLLEENVKLCLLSLSPESEVKVLAKNQLFLERGGAFASIFSGKSNSLAVD